MEKSKIFAELLLDVSRETEVPERDILSKRRDSECVDARHLFLYLLHRNGFYPSTIARMTGMCHRAVTFALSVFEDRLNASHMLRINLNALKVKWGGGRIKTATIRKLLGKESLFPVLCGYSFVSRSILTAMHKS